MRIGERSFMVLERIEIDPAVMMGKPVIKGARIPVETVLRELSEGATEADLVDAYPRLTPEDIKAAIRYAADVLGHEEILEEPPKAAASGGRWVRFLADEISVQLSAVS